MNPKSLNFEAVLPILTSILEKVGDKRVGNPQIAVLRSAWEHIDYADMSTQTPYNTGYLHRTIAPQVFKLMSEALGEKVNKRSLRKKIETMIANTASVEVELQEVRSVIGRPPLAKLFVGRKEELQSIDKFPGDKRCIYIYGAPGTGKTGFMARMFNQAKDDSLSKFDIFIWKYITHDSPLDEIKEIKQLLNLGDDVSFEDFARGKRLYLCLDGIEKWLHKNKRETEDFIQKFILTEHESRIIFTSREPLAQLDVLMKLGRPIMTLKLKGLLPEESQRIVKNYGLSGEWISELVSRYGGNPYLLHMLGERIQSNGGNAEPFLKCKTSLASEAMMPSFNQMFADNIEFNEVEKFLLTYLSHTSGITTFSIASLGEKISSLYSFEYSKVVQAIEKLRAYSLIEQLEDTDENKLPAYLKQYVVLNPLNIFSTESLLSPMAG